MKPIKKLHSINQIKLFFVITLFTILAVLVMSSLCWATTYYVDATNGNDSNPGILQSAPWKTIAKVNASNFNPGDSVLFKRDEVWREQLTVPSSGSPGDPITFGAYNSGDKPIISGANLVTGWTLESGNVWKTNATTEAHAVYFDGVRGTKKDSIGNLNQVHDWYWLHNILYVYSASAPHTNYTSPGIEAVVRTSGIATNQKSYITIDGLTIKQAWIWGIGDTNCNSDNWIVQNCTVQNIGPTSGEADPVGIYLGRYSDNWIIQDNTVSDTESIKETGSSLGAAIYIGNVYEGGDKGGDDNTIRRNMLTGGSTGIAIKYGGDGNLVTQNEIHAYTWSGIASIGEDTAGNTISYNFIHDIRGSGDSGIQVYGPDDIYGNIIENCFNGIYINCQSSDQENNFNACDDLKIYNNDIIDNYESIYFDNSGAPTAQNNLVKNNITVDTGANVGKVIDFEEEDDIVGAGNVFDHNLYYDTTSITFRIQDGTGDGGGFKTFAQWQAVYSQDSNSPTPSDPLFTNPGAGDFTLQSGSPAIGKGTDVGLTTDYLGNPIKGVPDIGAYEYYKEDSNQPVPPAGFSFK